MKLRPRLAAVAALILLCSYPIQAQQPRTQTLRLVLETSVLQPMTIPGMPAMGAIPGMPTGAPERTISGVATYAQAPVDPMHVTAPADLKLPNNRLVLKAPLGVAGPGQPGQETEDGEAPRRMQMTDKLYWHPDQARGPVTHRFTVQTGGKAGGAAALGMPNLGQIVDDALQHRASGAQGGLPADATGQGQYVLNTGGSATLDGFLPPLRVTSPNMAALNLAAPILVEWAPVVGARGFLLSAIGTNMEAMEAENADITSISWYSTLVEPPARVRGGYAQATTIADDLRDGILLPGNTTRCVIPGGIFTGIDMLILTVEAIGNDYYSASGGTTVFGTIRSEWRGMAMLMGGQEEDEEEE